MTPISLFLVALASTLTAFLSGFLGMAGGITLLAILTLLLPFPLVIPLHGVAQLLSNSFRLFFLRHSLHTKIFCFFILGAPWGTWISLKIIQSVENAGPFLVAMALMIFYSVLKPQKLPSFQIPLWGFSLVGFAAGVMGPLVGATGPFLALFFLRKDLSKEQIVATKSTAQLIIHALKIPTFLHLNFDYFQHGHIILILILTGFIGTKMGVKLLKKTFEKSFRLFYRIALFCCALTIFFKGLWLIL